MNKVNGFTLFELLVSISIIGILTTVVAFSFSSAQKKARDARRVTDMGSIQKAAELYYSTNSYDYPTNTDMPWTGASGTIIYNYPVDPKNSGDYIYTSGFIGGTTYCVCAHLEEVGKGNSGTPVCGFNNAASKDYYCVKNQQ